MSGNGCQFVAMDDPYSPGQKITLQMTSQEIDLIEKDGKFLKCCVLLHKKKQGQLNFKPDPFPCTFHDNDGEEFTHLVDYDIYYAIFMEGREVVDSIRNQFIRIRNTEKNLAFMATNNLSPSQQVINAQLLKECSRDKLGLIEYDGPEDEDDIHMTDLEQFLTEEVVDSEGNTEKSGSSSQGKVKRGQSKLIIKATEKSVLDWSGNEDRTLLKYYGENQHLLEKNARKFWITLTNKMNADYQVTADAVYSLKDVKTRITKLQRKYKEVVKANDQTGKDAAAKALLDYRKERNVIKDERDAKMDRLREEGAENLKRYRDRKLEILEKIASSIK